MSNFSNRADPDQSASLAAGPEAAPPRPSALAGLPPASFGIVMATGIVSLACTRLGLPGVGHLLFLLNVALYGLVWALLGLRLARHPDRVLNDVCDHGRSPGFFTTVAATSVLGTQIFVLTGSGTTALVLWWFALILWLGLTYLVFAALTVREDKPTLDRGINGGWLLAVVATQSLTVLGALLIPAIDESWRPLLAFVALSMWLCGGMLYIWLMTLIFYRYLFFRLSPADLAPPYWINMGAMALPFLRVVPTIFLVAALAAWVLAMLGLLLALGRLWRGYRVAQHGARKTLGR